MYSEAFSLNNLAWALFSTNPHGRKSHWEFQGMILPTDSTCIWKTIHLKGRSRSYGLIMSGILPIFNNPIWWIGLKVFDSVKAPTAVWSQCRKEPSPLWQCRMERALYIWITKILATVSFGV